MASEHLLRIYIYRHVAGCIAPLSAIIAPVSPPFTLIAQPITATQTTTNIETHTHISRFVCAHSTCTRGQRMNNAEVVSERKSPPLFPSFSPSLCNKEAMLPWRQRSPSTLAANYRLSCVKHRTNGCSDRCCCWHRHGDPIGWVLLFDWISDLVFKRKKYLKECHLRANLENLFFFVLFFLSREKMTTRWEGKYLCFIGLRDVQFMPFFFGSDMKWEKSICGSVNIFNFNSANVNIW